MSENDSGNFDIVKQFLHWGIFPNPDAVTEFVRIVKERNPGITRDDIIDKICGSAKRIAAGQGIVASLPGAIPGLGTAAQVAIMAGSAAPETVLLLRKMAHLQLCIAHLHGHQIHNDTDSQRINADRLEEFVIVLGIMTGAILPAKEAAKRYGGKFAAVQISRHVPGKVLREINRKIGFTLLTKFGTKRGGIALGRVIPLGIGAGIGGAMNYASINQFSKAVHKYYKESGDYVFIE